jgi:predicted RNase H-like HicB family nuclease
MSQQFTVILEAGPTGGFHVYCPALKGCHSEGETEAEAMENIQQAIELYVESLRAHGEPVPTQDVQVRSLAVAI